MLTCDQNEFDLDIFLSSWCKFEGENTLPDHSKSCSKLSSLSHILNKSTYLTTIKTLPRKGQTHEGNELEWVRLGSCRTTWPARLRPSHLAEHYKGRPDSAQSRCRSNDDSQNNETKIYHMTCHVRFRVEQLLYSEILLRQLLLQDQMLK